MEHHKQISVLDHGFVRLHNIAGPIRRTETEYDASDRDPAIVARTSFDNMHDPDRTVEQDEKLAEYLLKNLHTTPFEMITVWLEMKLPIFVARQFVRHRTVSINEVSARYVQLPEEWYIPEPKNVGLRPQNMKQGRELKWYELSNSQKDQINYFLSALDNQCKQSYELYEHGH